MKNKGPDGDYLNSNIDIIASLQNKFGKDFNGEIKNRIEGLQFSGLSGVNSVLGGKFFNSCFHPDEFGIGSYRVSSLVNQCEIADGIGMNSDDIFVDYLDTISAGGVKGFPNVKMSKLFGGKNLFSVIEEIGGKKISISTKDKIKIGNSLFDDFLNVSSLDKNIFNQKTLEFVKNILSDLGIYEKISEGIINFGYQEKNFENKIVSFLFKDKILKNFKEIKTFFLRCLMQKKYENGFSKSELYGEFQNSILSVFIDDNFGEKKEILENKKILKNGKIDFVNSRKNINTVNIFSNSIKVILKDEELGEDFFNSFFEEILINSGGKPVKIMDFKESGESGEFSEDGKSVSVLEKKDLFVYREGGELIFYKGNLKAPKKIKNEEGFRILTGEGVSDFNLSGNLTIFLKGISGSLHIGSERGYREIAGNSVEKFFESKGQNNEDVQNYIHDIILGLGIFDTFDEGGCNVGKNLAGSSGSLPKDIFKMGIIGGDFSKNQTDMFLKDNSKTPEFNEEDFLNSFSGIFENIENRLNNIKGVKISDGLDEEFLEKKDIFNNEKNFENFLNLLKYSYKLDKVLK